MLPLSVYEPQLVEAAEVINELKEGTEGLVPLLCGKFPGNGTFT